MLFLLFLVLLGLVVLGLFLLGADLMLTDIGFLVQCIGCRHWLCRCLGRLSYMVVCLGSVCVHLGHLLEFGFEEVSKQCVAVLVGIVGIP